MIKFRLPNESRMEVSETLAGYSMQAQHPKTGETAEEVFTGIKDAIARAATLIGAGYIVEITSATLLRHSEATAAGQDWHI